MLIVTLLMCGLFYLMLMALVETGLLTPVLLLVPGQRPLDVMASMPFL